MLWTMLTYEMITNAQQGDPYAMQQILNHYAGYINYAASFVHPYNYGRLNRDIQELGCVSKVESMTAERKKLAKPKGN